MSQLSTTDSPNEQSAAAADTLLSIRGLRKVFQHGGRELAVLKGIDLDLKKGEMVSVVGPSGAGKSTLLHIIGALDRPTAGNVVFDGRDLAKVPPGQLADFRNRSIGFVFQFHHLLPDFTAVENVMMPCLIQRITRRRAMEQAALLLEEVGLAERLDHKPGELSGGEQQRVALARALVLEPRLLLADEPTGNLDSGTSGAIHELFFSINERRNTTMMIVTHNPGLAERMPRQLRMVDGRIEEDERAQVGYREPAADSSIASEALS